MADTYADERREAYILKIRKLLKEMPPFCAEFARGMENNTSVLTRFNYLTDLKVFLKYLVEERIDGRNTPADVTLEDLDKLEPIDFELYMDYIGLYIKGDNTITNKENGKARKLASLRSLYKYFNKKGKLSKNPVALLETPKIYKKVITRLEANEVADMLDIVESGSGLSKRQQKYHELTEKRDLAIITVFLGSGIRISELVGLNISDVNFMTNEFVITRKGGNQDVLPFGAELRTALLDYMTERENIITLEGSEDALFLSMQRKRISVRAVENLVKKYAIVASPLKKISPHKLRSTYGTMLYQETGDIYLVADVLGHKDVNTTRKHYTTIELERKREAAKAIKLREETDMSKADD